MVFLQGEDTPHVEAKLPLPIGAFGDAPAAEAPADALGQLLPVPAAPDALGGTAGIVEALALHHPADKIVVVVLLQAGDLVGGDGDVAVQGKIPLPGQYGHPGAGEHRYSAPAVAGIVPVDGHHLLGLGGGLQGRDNLVHV